MEQAKELRLQGSLLELTFLLLQMQTHHSLVDGMLTLDNAHSHTHHQPAIKPLTHITYHNDYANN